MATNDYTRLEQLVATVKTPAFTKLVDALQADPQLRQRTDKDKLLQQYQVNIPSGATVRIDPKWAICVSYGGVTVCFVK